MIHFTLDNIDDIHPWGSNWGSDADLSLHWFGLTSGTLYLTFGKSRIYEYTDAAVADFGEGYSKYVDYQISRFVEDFSELFRAISESIPKRFYGLTETLPAFLSDADKWLDIHCSDEDGDEDEDFYDNHYDPLTSWVHNRALVAQHLTAGPNVYFFRCGQKLRIVWEVRGKTETGADMWTARDGHTEINYSDFVEAVKDFGNRFFKSMENQVRQAVAKDWGKVKLDKQQLSEEQQERRKQFFGSIAHLEAAANEGAAGETNWQKTSDAYQKMRADLSAK